MSDSPKYDSAEDTWRHKHRVGELMVEIVHRLEHRAYDHDDTKLGIVEKPLFDLYTTRLKGMKYGSEEYKETLALLKPALDHHYAHNAHHPEARPDGVRAMSLIDLLEMLADWKAAAERHQRADCNLVQSLIINRKRFAIPDPIYRQLVSTAMELGWVKPEDKEALLPKEEPHGP